MDYGEGLKQHLVVHAGDFVYIPANVPNLPYNLSQTEPCTAVSRAPIPTSRKASSSCPSWRRLTREPRYFRSFPRKRGPRTTG